MGDQKAFQRKCPLSRDIGAYKLPGGAGRLISARLCAWNSQLTENILDLIERLFSLIKFITTLKKHLILSLRAA